MRPLSEDQYAKKNFRQRMAALSFEEKVRCVVEMQKRLVPILAARGRVIVPWTL
jgi:hypothetical protein